MENFNMESLAKAMGGSLNNEGKIEVQNVDFVDGTGQILEGAIKEEVKAPEVSTETTNTTDNTPVNQEQEIKQPSSLHTENTVTPPVTTPTPQVKTFEEQFREKFGEDFNEEVVSKYKAPKQEFANETIAKLNEYIKGFDDPQKALETFMSTQLTDYTKITDEQDLIIKGMLLDNPSLTKEEAKVLLSFKYRMDEWQDEETPSQLQNAMKIQMKTDAEKARRELVANQQKWAVPPAIKKQEIDAAEIQRQKAENESQIQTFKTNVSNAVRDYSKETFLVSLGDKESANVDFDIQDRTTIEQSINDLVLNPSNFVLSRYANSNGALDFGKIKRDMAILNNYEKILSATYRQAKNEGAATIAKEINNTDFSTSGRSLDPGKKSLQEQILEKTSIGL